MNQRDLETRDKQEVAPPREGTGARPCYVPAVDIFESREALTLIADMPGVSAENLEIDLKDGKLSLYGKVGSPEEKGNYLLREYRSGDYCREFTLGRMIDQTRIEAKMKDGVLTLILPKLDAVKPRKITVKAV